MTGRRPYGQVLEYAHHTAHPSSIDLSANCCEALQKLKDMFHYRDLALLSRQRRRIMRGELMLYQVEMLDDKPGVWQMPTLACEDKDHAALCERAHVHEGVNTPMVRAFLEQNVEI